MERNLDKKDAAGMTVNERLYLAGSLDDFDKAVTQNDKSKMQSILEKVYFSQKDAELIVQQLLES